jgi:hypothetical protein
VILLTFFFFFFFCCLLNLIVQTSDYEPYNDLWQYDIKNGTWQWINGSADATTPISSYDYPSALANPSRYILDGDVYLLGGGVYEGVGMCTRKKRRKKSFTFSSKWV